MFCVCACERNDFISLSENMNGAGRENGAEQAKTAVARSGGCDVNNLDHKRNKKKGN